MAQKNETPILVIALLITVGLVGGGIWWFTRNSGINLSKSDSTASNSSQSSPSSQPSQSGSNSSPSSNNDTLASVPLTSSKGVDYTALRQDLQSHNWKQANEDTTEALLKAFGPH